MTCNSDSFYLHYISAAVEEYNGVDSEPDYLKKLDKLNAAMDNLNLARKEIHSLCGKTYHGLDELYNLYTAKFEEIVLKNRK